MFQEMIRQIQRAETISYTGKIENIVGGNKTLRLREIADFIYSRDH